MKTKTLFLAWQDKDRTRKWFPVGRLDAKGGGDPYHFRYIRGAERAHNESGFEPLYDFPDLHQTYVSSDLFPLFKNRVLTSGRGDFPHYLEQLDLSPGQADPIEILSVDGGYRATDSFEVFPKIEPRQDGAFHCRFFLHGWRHLSEDAQRRLQLLQSGENLSVAIELTNPKTQWAIQIQTLDYYMIGWAPLYLAHDLAGAVAEGAYHAKVVRVNPAPAPSKQRLLVELSGHWPGHAPMTTGDFEPLSK